MIFEFTSPCCRVSLPEKLRLVLQFSFLCKVEPHFADNLLNSRVYGRYIYIVTAVDPNIFPSLPDVFRVQSHFSSFGDPLFGESTNLPRAW